jgi:hypothetical protein
MNDSGRVNNGPRRPGQRDRKVEVRCHRRDCDDCRRVMARDAARDQVPLSPLFRYKHEGSLRARGAGRKEEAPGLRVPQKRKPRRGQPGFLKGRSAFGGLRSSHRPTRTDLRRFRSSAAAQAFGRPSDGEAFGVERLVRRGFHRIRRRRGSFFRDLGEQPSLNRSVRPLSLRIVMGETTGLEDYGAQLGDAAATTVVEVHKRKSGSGHCVLQERDRRCRRQAMLAAQMQKSADKAMPAVSVIITARASSGRRRQKTRA